MVALRPDREQPGVQPLAEIGERLGGGRDLRRIDGEGTAAQVATRTVLHDVEAAELAHRADRGRERFDRRAASPDLARDDLDGGADVDLGLARDPATSRPRGARPQPQAEVPQAGCS